MRVRRIGVLLVPIAIGGWWLMASSPTAPPSTLLNAAQVSQEQTSAARQLSSSPAGVEQIHTDIADYSALFAPQPPRSTEATRAGIEERERAAAETAARLSAHEPADLLQAFRGAERSREKLLLVEAVSQSEHPDALAVLQELTWGAERHGFREAALRGVTHSADEARDDALMALLLIGDERLRAQAAQGLFGAAVALDALVHIAWIDDSRDVRAEAMHSISGIGTSPARDALESLSTEHDDPATRTFAARALQRSEG